MGNKGILGSVEDVFAGKISFYEHVIFFIQQINNKVLVYYQCIYKCMKIIRHSNFKCYLDWIDHDTKEMMNKYLTI